MGYKIQLLDQSKLQETIDVCMGCFGEKWRHIADKDFPASLSDYVYKPNTFIGLNDQDQVVGMSVVTPVFLTPDTYSISWLGTKEEYRRQGIAASLVRACEQYILDELMMFDKAMVMLAAEYHKEYYEALGYEEKFTTQHGAPFMAKYLNK